MRLLLKWCCLLGIFLPVLTAQVRISQIYGGGGNAGSAYKNDFIEIFNAGSITVSLNGWSVQYASATGTGNFSSNSPTALSGSIGPGQYYLVQEASGGAGTTNLPAPDATGTINMSATAGKVVLVNTTTGLACNGGSTPCNSTQLASILDLIGYGNANFFEGAGDAPTLSVTAAALRASNGCTDTDNNSADFTAGSPSPRNTASAANPCGGSTPLSITTSTSLPNATVNVFYSVTFAATGGSGSGYTFSQTGGTLPANLNLVGATLSGTPTSTVGSPFSFTIQVTDSAAHTASAIFSLTVLPPPPAPKHIYEITGSGLSSPLAGQTVTVSGVVTALRPNSGSTRGYYIESLPADRDSDPNTSEGLLIFTGSLAPPACAVAGNLIQIDGTVQDFVAGSSPAGSVPLTELSGTANCQILGTNQLAALPSGVVLGSSDLAVGGSAALLRKYLSMRATLSNASVVAPSLGNLTESSATAVPSGTFFVTLPATARPLRGAGILDTRRPSNALSTVPHWNGDPEVLRVNTTGLAGGTAYEVTSGATINLLSGIIDFNTSQGQFQLYTDASGAGMPNPSTPTRAATPVPAALPSDLTIAAFNLERFYNDMDDGNGNPVILTTAAYRGRLNKVSLAIRNVLHMPDVIGLEEVEGPLPTSPQVFPVAQDVVNKLNSDAVSAGQGNPNYNWCQFATNDISFIDVVVLYKQGRVTLNSCVQYGLNTTFVQPGGSSAILNDRPPLVAQLSASAPGSDSGITLRFIVNHLRSLSGIDDPTPGNGDRVRAKRNEQAKYLANLIQGNIPSENSTNWNTADNLVLVGDFNAYQVNDGYVDSINCIAGNPAPANQQYTTASQSAASPACAAITNPPLTVLTNANPAALYSYTFSGSFETLDHVIANSKILPRVRQIAYARNNGDFSEGATYRNDFTRPERVSDHDMPIAYVTLPVEVTSRTRVNASAPNLNRATGRYNSNISVTNTGSTRLNGPLYVFFNTLTAGVTLPDLPAFGGVPYLTINVPGGLAPGATSATAVASFADPSNARIGYTTTRFDGTF